MSLYVNIVYSCVIYIGYAYYGNTNEKDFS